MSSEEEGAKAKREMGDGTGELELGASGEAEGGRGDETRTLSGLGMVSHCHPISIWHATPFKASCKANSCLINSFAAILPLIKPRVDFTRWQWPPLSRHCHAAVTWSSTTQPPTLNKTSFNKSTATQSYLISPSLIPNWNQLHINCCCRYPTARHNLPGEFLLIIPTLT